MSGLGARPKIGRTLRDEPKDVREAVLSQVGGVDAIITTGGTGITSRDSTYEAIAGLLEKRLDGFGELFRALSYQEIGSAQLRLLSSDDGGALVRLIAGDLAGHAGPGVTWTPISYAHASISPAARLQVPWRADFNALVYVLSGIGTAGPEGRPLREGQLAVFGPGESLTVQAAAQQEGRSPSLEVLLLGGRPLREPAIFYGPFVMNTHEEIVQAIEDYRAGRMGTIPASYLTP